MESTANALSIVSETITAHGLAVTFVSFVIVLTFLVLTVIIKTWITNINNTVESTRKYIDNMSENNSKLLDMIENLKSNPTNIHHYEDECIEVDGIKYEEKNIMSIFIKLNYRLKQECKEVLESIGSDRTAIYLFHNGASSSHGLPFFKMSCISEYINNTCGSSTSKLKDHTNIPINLFDDMVEKLYHEGEYVLSEDTCDSDQILYKVLLKNKKKNCIFCSIMDAEYRIMGFIVSEFSSTLLKEDIIKYKIKLKKLASRVSPILEFSNYRNTYLKGGL